MHLMNVHLKLIKLCSVLNEHKLQNQYMKEMLSKAFDTKFSSKHL